MASKSVYIHIDLQTEDLGQEFKRFDNPFYFFFRWNFKACSFPFPDGGPRSHFLVKLWLAARRGSGLHGNTENSFPKKVPTVEKLAKSNFVMGMLA